MSQPSRASKKKWAEAHPDKQREAIYRWRKANPEKYNGYQREYRARNRDRILAQRRARRTPQVEKYGITAQDYESLLAAQGGRCAICNGVAAGRRLAVDHHHASGLVRGLLCDLCNWMLGMAKDSPERLLAGARYLEAHRVVSE